MNASRFNYHNSASLVPKGWSNDPKQLQAVSANFPHDSFGLEDPVPSPHLASTVDNGDSRALVCSSTRIYVWDVTSERLFYVSNPHNLRGILRRLSVDSPELQVNEPRTLQYILQTLNDTSMMALEGLNLENLDLLQDTGARIESLMTMYPMVGPTKSDAKLSTTNGAVDTDSVFAHLLSSTGRVTSTES